MSGKEFYFEPGFVYVSLSFQIALETILYVIRIDIFQVNKTFTYFTNFSVALTTVNWRDCS